MASTTILFIPGAWHNPNCFQKVTEKLEVAGYNTELVHLPSVDPAIPHSDFSDDVSQVKRQIQALVDIGQRVVVVVHSYGGLPGTEAIKDLDWETRQHNGQPGGVVHLFFCASFVVPEGQSLMGSLGGNDLPWFRVSDDRLLVNPADPDKIFYNDMPEDEVRVAVAALRPHSYQAFHSRITYASWKHVPSTYLYCPQDAAIPIDVQKWMVEEVAKGVPFRTETVDASHSPFISVPEELTAAIIRAAG